MFKVCGEEIILLTDERMSMDAGGAVHEASTIFEGKDGKYAPLK